MTGDTVRLTIILCGRNDHYGGDFLDRLNRSLTWNSNLARECKVSVELLFVEYNPPQNTASIASLDFWPKNEYWKNKIITVERGFNSFEEFPAKNIGLRRASGEFILAANADILLPDSFFHLISTLTESDRAIYRADRLNVLPAGEISEGQLIRTTNEYCMQGGIFHRRSSIPHQLYYPLLKAYLPLRRFIYRLFKLRPASERFLLDYHFVASGDFTLAHRDIWFRLRGYREHTTISTHVDSLFLLKAISHSIGIRTVNFPVYHQDHRRRHDFSQPSKDMKLMWSILQVEITTYLDSRKPIRDTDDNWGQPDANFSEIAL